MHNVVARRYYKTNNKMRTIIGIITLLTLVGVISCAEPPSHEQWQKHQDKECASKITKFNYEGHSYLLYRDGIGDCRTAGITHDANCPCYKIPDSDFD